jgi:uncharacterized protein (DUF2236 family)
VTCSVAEDADRTVVARVLEERVLALAWGSALLLHVADPRIAQGVADHSVFLNAPSRRLERLYSTANTMLDLLVGAPSDIRAASDRINRIHDQVHGVMHECHPRTPLGAPYSAHDPELLKWVHVALHVILLRAYTTVVGPLSDADRDGYCRAVATVEPVLRMPGGTLPRDARMLHAEFITHLPELSVGEQARQIARGILYPSLPYWGAPLSRFARLWIVGLLPDSVKALYGFRWERRHARAFAISVRLTRGLLPLIPARARHVPPALMLRWRPTAELHPYGRALRSR